MEINGMTRTCGLIGNPVGHTMSPFLHDRLAGKTNENLVYVPLLVQTGQLKEAVAGAYALNFLGCNVTIPYKTDVLSFLKEIDPLAERIGAVNTLVRIEGGWKGYNTDMPGLYRAMRRDGVVIEGEQVVILGAGGVARAVAMMLAEKGAKRIWILNRTTEKAQAIAGEINRLFDQRPAEALALQDYAALKKEGSFLAIQATNVGMYPDTEKAVIEDADFYSMIHTGYDLIFNPRRTRFMELVNLSGGRAFDGLRMLLYQGVIAFELWTGKDIDDRAADEIYEQMCLL